MSLVATERAPLRPLGLPRRTIVAIVALCAAAAAVVLRPTTLPYPTFAGACQRLRASGLPITTRDWFCQPTPFVVRASFAIALLLVAIGLVLPCAILAATGRRWSSLVPLVVAPAMTLSGLYSVVRWWDTGAASRSGVVIAASNALVLAAPVVAIWLVSRPHEHREHWPGLAAALVAGAVCSVASGFAGFLADRLLSNHWASMGGGNQETPLGPAMYAMAFFGLMLGTDRRWWPWSLAPVALLLSGAPSAAIIRNPQGLTDWSQFGVVVPVALVGLAWSTWRPMSTWLAARLDRSRETGTPSLSRAGRGAFALNAGALALFAMSVVLFRADPLPAQIGMSLPSYLGERVQAEDVRTKLNLRQAIGAMDAYAATSGTYRGFDAATGERAEPSLAWSDGYPNPALTVAIESATKRTARVLAWSTEGAVFCLERDRDGALTYGGVPSDGGAPGVAMFQHAIAVCGSTPWSGAAVRMLDTATLCDGVDQSSYLICRMVQIWISDAMRQTQLS